MKIIRNNKTLLEDRELYQGIFWIVDLDSIYNNEDYCFLIPSDSNGNVINDLGLDLNAKSGTTFNHERVWKSLDSNLTNNKPFNYYPRGRVQIVNNKAVVYLNPNINFDEVQKFIEDEFNLTPFNGIKSIRYISDGSDHYKCYLDE